MVFSIGQVDFYINLNASKPGNFSASVNVDIPKGEGKAIGLSFRYQENAKVFEFRITEETFKNEEKSANS